MPVLLNAPVGAFSNTGMLHLAVTCQEYLIKRIFKSLVFREFTVYTQRDDGVAGPQIRVPADVYTRHRFPAQPAVPLGAGLALV